MLICWFIMMIRVIMSTSLTVFSILLMRNNRNVCLPQLTSSMHLLKVKLYLHASLE